MEVQYIEGSLKLFPETSFEKSFLKNLKWQGVDVIFNSGMELGSVRALKLKPKVEEK